MSIDDVNGAPAGYGPRLIAWVDILGWEDLTKDPAPERFKLIAKGLNVVSLIARIDDLRRGVIEYTAHKQGSAPLRLSAHRTHFSDTIVFSCAPDPYEVWLLVHDVQQLCGFLLGAGHYTRGGITLGNAHHDVEGAYGPAFIEAYRLESSVAYYPRLVISDQAAEPLGRMRVGSGGPVEWSPIVEDVDGLNYLEIFRREPDGSRADQLIEQVRRIRQRVLVDIERTHDRSEPGSKNRVTALNHRAKYGWMLRYLDDVLANQGKTSSTSARKRTPAPLKPPPGSRRARARR